jgi:hypothetical protein
MEGFEKRPKKRGLQIRGGGAERECWLDLPGGKRGSYLAESVLVSKVAID